MIIGVGSQRKNKAVSGPFRSQKFGYILVSLLPAATTTTLSTLYRPGAGARPCLAVGRDIRCLPLTKANHTARIRQPNGERGPGNVTRTLLPHKVSPPATQRPRDIPTHINQRNTHKDSFVRLQSRNTTSQSLSPFPPPLSP